jgi:hypothetical protein
MRISTQSQVLPYVSPKASASVNAPPLSVEQIKDAWSGQLKPDQMLTFRIPGSQSFTLQGKETPPAGADGILDGVTKTVKSVLSELIVGAQSGPCLALTLAGAVTKPIACLGLDSVQMATVNSIYTPALRGVCMAVSGVQMVESWKRLHKKEADNKPASTADYLNMGLNGLHVMTCAAGVAGAIAGAVSPSLGHLANLGLSIAVAGDILSLGANRLQYVSDRSKLNSEDMQGI